MTQKNRTSSRITCTVGIGASAGGLEALEQLFDHLPGDLGAAYVIVQHLSPNYRSFMAELLSHHTTMNIYLAKHKMKLEPNTIYLIPPKKTLIVQGGKLLLSTPSKDSGLPMPIDRFLQSLAEDSGEAAAAVILSGSGSDGSRGIEAVKKAGGFVIVQQEDSAKFDGMPKSAIRTGAVHAVVPPDEIGPALLKHIQSVRQNDLSLTLAENAMRSHQDDIKEIYTLLQRQTGVEFTHYKQGSVMRRIERRMGILGIHDLPSYVAHLRTHTEEVQDLHKDLLIGVTHFFRDPEAFDTLNKKVLPVIFKNKQREKEIRIWVAGCSTGEEAYSMAMLFRQYMDQLDDAYNVKIFATDLDKEAIEFASQGVYPMRIENTLPKPWLERYFVKIQDEYHIQKTIRKMVVFAQHNIIKDPPFISLDLVSCRNMLIYLQPETQRKVISLFHFALNPTGFMFLGPSETIGKLTNLFTPFDNRWNIFQYREVGNQRLSDPFSVGTQINEKVREQRIYSRMEKPKPQDKADLITQELVLQFLPPCLLVDENDEIVYSNGNVSPFLHLPQGRPSHQIMKLVPPSLSVAVGSAIHKARKEQTEVSYRDIKLVEKEELQYVNIKAQPFPTAAADKGVLLFFEQVEHKASFRKIEEHFDVNSNMTQRIADLEHELQHAEEYLQATIEELETSNEELQATNEELIAANEELQSTNEELQSLNEELITVNNEYQEKIQQLTELNNDMDNLLNSTRIGTLFLDERMCVRRFTPSLTGEINLLEVDIGRPVAHISHNFKYGSIVRDAQKVLRTSGKLEREIQSYSGKWYNMRMLPYVANDKSIQGVVITFHDITELKTANEELQLLSHAIQQSPSIVVITDPHWRAQYVNPRFVERTGYRREEVLGLNVMDLFDTLPEEQRARILADIAAGKRWTGEAETRTKSGETYWEFVSLLSICNPKGEILHFMRISEDITERKNSEELLRKSEMLSAVGQLAAGIAHEIRNPLTALKGFTKLLQTSGSKKDYTAIMSAELERIETIISELLILAKPQALQYQSRNLVELIHDVVMLLDTQAIMTGVEIDFDPNMEPCPIECVPNQLKQVFINLLKNAVEAMPKGGRVTIRIKANEKRDVTIRVVDQGEGIPQENISSIGQPFYTTKEKGTGLGLMMSFKIIENHGGSMAISSRVGEGTTITIRLPFEQE